MQAEVSVKESVIRILDELPPERISEVLDFALFIKERTKAEVRKSQKPEVKAAPVESLKALAGLVALGGDAVEDADKCYE